MHVLRSGMCIYSKLVAMNMVIKSIGAVKTVSEALVLGSVKLNEELMYRTSELLHHRNSEYNKHTPFLVHIHHEQFVLPVNIPSAIKNK